MLRLSARAVAITIAFSVIVPACSADDAKVASPPAAAAPQADGGCAPRRAEDGDVRCVDACFDALGPTLRLALDPATLGLSPPPAGSLAIGVGIFLTTSPHEPARAWTKDDVAAQVSAIVSDTNAVLRQCSMHVRLEAAHVVALPARLLDIQGNAEGSWGGHPPAGTTNPDLFNYEQNERLTSEVRELFAYGKAHTSKNAIAAFTVRHITYYAEKELTEAGGLSFPPSNYHHVDDYPLRNSVLLVPAYGACGELPSRPAERTLAHELGHMLLDSGLHEDDRTNLMSGLGGVLTPAQCERMRKNLGALYGDAEVPDPGPPP